MDLASVDTLAELGTLLKALAKGRKLNIPALERAAGTLPPKWDRLPTTSISEMQRGERISEGKLRTYLEICGVSRADAAKWFAALDRAKTRESPSPNATRVNQATPRYLGVHAAIHSDRATAEPSYVERDLDAAIRSAIGSAAQDGGFIVLVGGSSVGKTRTLYEALLNVVPNRWLLHPASAGEVAEHAAHAPRKTVIWLDELQNYFTPGSAINSATIRRLIGANNIIAATIWPTHFHRMSVADSPDSQVLRLATVFDIPHSFSSSELDRARLTSTHDSRIRKAIESGDAEVTQLLAAGPYLIRAWEQAPSPAARAFITAAVDARRLGIYSPLTLDFLTTAATGYLTSHQIGGASPDWLQEAITYATTPLQGAASPLRATGTDHIGISTGFVAADFLVQHGQSRVNMPLPDSLWKASAQHTDNADDQLRTGWAAHTRSMTQWAYQLFELAAYKGNRHAIRGLADVLLQLRRPSDAAVWLMKLLDGETTDSRFISALRRCGLDTEAADVTRLAADAGDPAALLSQAKVLSDQGDAEAAAEAFAKAADRGSVEAVGVVLKTLCAVGDIDAAVTMLHRAASAQPDLAHYFSRRTAEILRDAGRHEEATNTLRKSAETGDESAMHEFGVHLVKSGDSEGIEWLKKAVDKHHLFAFGSYADALREAGRIAEADMWQERAAYQGNPNAIEAHLATMDGPSATKWIQGMAESGDEFALYSYLERLDDPKDQESWLADLAQRGESIAFAYLVKLLTGQSRLDEAEQWLRQGMITGRLMSTNDLATLLEQSGKPAEADQLRVFGLDSAGRTADPWT